jgi:hypothetical protein
VLIETEGAGNNQVVHFGGDIGPEEGMRKGPLYFYNNTVVSRRSDTTTLLRLSTNAITADVRNNILFVTAAGEMLSILDETGLVRLEHNWIKPGWKECHGMLKGTIRPEGMVSTADPGFANEAAGNFRLRADSACIDQGSEGLLRDEHRLKLEFKPPRGGTPRREMGAVDLGAFEFVP